MAVPATSTRSQDNLYLIGSYVDEIFGAKLPSYRQALGHFLYLYKVEKQTVRDSSRSAIEAVSAFWHKAGIPVRATQHTPAKLEAVFYEWKGLRSCFLERFQRVVLGFRHLVLCIEHDGWLRSFIASRCGSFVASSK